MRLTDSRLADAIAADGRLADRDLLGSGSPLMGFKYRRMDIAIEKIAT